MGMGRNGNGLHGNGREWEYEKPFPVISILQGGPKRGYSAFSQISRKLPKIII